MLAARLERGFNKIKKNAYQKGKLEGKLEERRFFAKSLYNKNYTIEQIADIMDISVDEVKELLTSQNN